MYHITLDTRKILIHIDVLKLMHINGVLYELHLLGEAPTSLS